MDLAKLITEYLHEEGFYVSYQKGKVCVRLSDGSVIKINYRKDKLYLEEYVEAGNSVTIMGYPQLNLKSTEIGDIHDPGIFKRLLHNLERREAAAAEESIRKVGDANRSRRGGTIYRK